MTKTDLEQIADAENETGRSLVRRIYDFGSKFIDYKVGLAGAVVMGGIVFEINYHDTQDMIGSTTAALKQAGYTSLFGGMIMKGCEYLATHIRSRTTALISSVVIPSIISISLTYGMHNLKGTPKPEESTIPTVALVFPATAIWGYRKRNQLESENVNT